MSVENPSFENKPQLEQTGEKLKTDWSYVDGILKKMDDERRAKLSPEELAEDDKKKQRVAETLRFFERQKIKKTGTPEEIKQVEEEERLEREESERQRTELAAQQEEERRSKLNPKEIAEEDKRKKQVEETLKFFDNQKKSENGTPEEKKEAQKELEAGKRATERLVDETIAAINEQTQRDVGALKQRTYEQIKSQTEKFRQERGLKVSEAQLKKEDQELRKRLGLK